MESVDRQQGSMNPREALDILGFLTMPRASHAEALVKEAYQLLATFLEEQGYSKTEWS